jgi:hypothetical protein
VITGRAVLGPSSLVLRRRTGAERDRQKPTTGRSHAGNSSRRATTFGSSRTGCGRTPRPPVLPGREWPPAVQCEVGLAGFTKCKLRRPGEGVVTIDSVALDPQNDAAVRRPRRGGLVVPRDTALARHVYPTPASPLRASSAIPIRAPGFIPGERKSPSAPCSKRPGTREGRRRRILLPSGVRIPPEASCAR